ERMHRGPGTYPYHVYVGLDRFKSVVLVSHLGRDFESKFVADPFEPGQTCCTDPLKRIGSGPRLPDSGPEQINLYIIFRQLLGGRHDLRFGFSATRTQYLNGPGYIFKNWFKIHLSII